MIYLDTSVALARVLAEPRRPPPSFWAQTIASSRLLRYEILNRVHASGRQDRLGREVELILSTVEMLDLSAEILSRALQPFPLPVRTPDALHLATMAFIRARGREVVVASYDLRLLAAAKAIGIESIDP